MKTDTSNSPYNSQSWLTATAATTALLGTAALLYRINWPRLLFRTIFAVLAPTKERLWPSDDVALVSPQSRGMAWILVAGPPPPHDIHLIRKMMRHFWPHVWPPIDSNQIQVESLPTPREDSETILIWPSSSTSTFTDSNNNTALIHVHGGGMVAGTTGTERGFAVELARRLQVPVLSVDYRLCPEYSVQEAVQDVVDAYQYFVTKYPQYTKLSFLGGSAGAGHALLATLQLQKEKIQPLPTSLVLSSPGPGMEFLKPIDDIHNSSTTYWKSLTENAPVDGFMVGGFYQYVIGVVFGSNQANREYVQSQLQVSNLQKLPPTLVTAGSYEVILEGVQKLVSCLQKANVKVDYKEYQKMQHCHFAFFEWSPESSAALDELITWLQASWK